MLQILIFDVHLKIDKFKELSKYFVVTYPVYFSLPPSHSNQVCAEESVIYLPKRLKWNEYLKNSLFQILDLVGILQLEQSHTFQKPFTEDLYFNLVHFMCFSTNYRSNHPVRSIINFVYTIHK